MDLIEASDPDGPAAKAEPRRVLYAILAELGGRSGKISPTGIGKFIARYESRIEGGLRFERVGKMKGSVLWRVKVMNDYGKTPAEHEVGEFVAAPVGTKSGEIISVKHVGRSKIVIRKGRKKSIDGTGNPVPNSGNAPAQEHQPHPATPGVNGPDQTIPSQEAGAPGSEQAVSATFGIQGGDIVEGPATDL